MTHRNIQMSRLSSYSLQIAFGIACIVLALFAPDPFDLIGLAWPIALFFKYRTNVFAGFRDAREEAMALKQRNDQLRDLQFREERAKNLLSFQLEQLRTYNDTVSAEKAKAFARIRALEKQVDSLDTYNRRLSGEHSDALAAAAKETAQLRRQYRDVVVARDAAAGAFASLNKDYANLQRQCREMTAARDGTAGEVTALRKEYVTLKQSTDRVLLERADLVAVNSALTKDLDYLNRMLRASERLSERARAGGDITIDHLPRGDSEFHRAAMSIILDLSMDALAVVDTLGALRYSSKRFQNLQARDDDPESIVSPRSLSHHHDQMAADGLKAYKATGSVNGGAATIEVYAVEGSDLSIVRVHGDQPYRYTYRNSPLPRPRSTLSLAGLLSYLDGPGTGADALVEIGDEVRETKRGTLGFQGSAERSAAETIQALVRRLKPRLCVEIGCYIGSTTSAVAAALRDNDDGGRLIGIEVSDWHAALTRATLQEKGLADLAEIRLGNSADEAVWSDMPPIDFAFIDGDHSYEAARADLQSVARRASDSCVIVFHDTIKAMALARLMDELVADQAYETFAMGTEDGDGLTILLPRRVSAVAEAAQ